MGKIKALMDFMLGKPNGPASLDKNGNIPAAQFGNLTAGGAAQLTQDGGNAVITASGKNLLDNWYFADPINQRNGYVVQKGDSYYSKETQQHVGFLPTYVKVTSVTDGDYPHFLVDGVEYYGVPSSYVPGYVGSGYTIDRWRITTDGTGTVQIIPGEGVKITAISGSYFDLRQILENIDADETVTISAIINGNLHTATGKFGMSLNISADGYSGVIYYIENAVILRPNIGNVWMVKAVKLELGSTQTLAHQDADGNWVLNDPPPDPALELLKCRRYFIQERMNVSSVRVGDYATFHVAFHICNPMRANPDVYVGEPIHISNGKVIVDIPASAITVHTSISPSQFVISFAVPEGMSNGDTLYFDALITLSAEL